jgi:hypothetical protein
MTTYNNSAKNGIIAGQDGIIAGYYRNRSEIARFFCFLTPTAGNHPSHRPEYLLSICHNGVADPQRFTVQIHSDPA